MSEPFFIFNRTDPAMVHASEEAQRTFRYFWRELHWERRRIVPGLDMAMVKLPFTDGPRTDGRPDYEHMWVDDLDFDGETLSGVLINQPNWLTSVKQGDFIQMPFSHLGDWMMSVGGRAYGGFTVNLMRAGMDSQERKEHDEAWGLDFGDPANVQVELSPPEKPKGGLLAGLFSRGSKESTVTGTFHDHPMCVNSLEKIGGQLRNDPSLASSVDEGGWSLLHREALGGNWGVVKLLVKHGADVAAKTESGRTAAELARGIGWPEIADYLDAQPNG